MRCEPVLTPVPSVSFVPWLPLRHRGSTVPRPTPCWRSAGSSPAGRSPTTAASAFRKGGRAGDVFYRDRWSHDKVVRSTHGVNCTGSCSWKVYVKDGIITWETQQTDYPSVGPDRPEYEPRGCPRGAAFSWYTYSPTRVRYPYVRGVLLEMYREAKAAAAATRCSPGRSHRRPREAAAATSRPAARAGSSGRRGPRRSRSPPRRTCTRSRRTAPTACAGFSPIPAMSMVSHCVGTRFTQLIGGVMTSFYDWYADLPVASPQVFGDQTDVPESGDWWDATYLMMWGSNVPVTRTPDAHWMAEVRYRGTKVVTVSPDYADNTKFADEWMPAQAGTDAALAMAMGHVFSRSTSSSAQTPFFADYVRTYTDLPFLIRLEPRHAAHGGAWCPGKFLTAADLGDPARRLPAEDAWKTVLLDEATGEPVVPNGSMGFRYAESGVGPLEPRPRGRHPGAVAARTPGGRRRSRCCCRPSPRPTAPGRCCAAACRPAGSAGTWSPRCST